MAMPEYLAKRPVAIGSFSRIMTSGWRMNLSSHLASLRAVTPARSGPTRSPPPTVWQDAHLSVKDRFTSSCRRTFLGRKRRREGDEQKEDKNGRRDCGFPIRPGQNCFHIRFTSLGTL